MLNALTGRLGIREETAGWVELAELEEAQTDGRDLVIQGQLLTDTGKDLREVPEKTAGISLADLRECILLLRAAQDDWKDRGLCRVIASPLLITQ